MTVSISTMTMCVFVFFLKLTQCLVFFVVTCLTIISFGYFLKIMNVDLSGKPVWLFFSWSFPSFDINIQDNIMFVFLTIHVLTKWLLLLYCNEFNIYFLCLTTLKYIMKYSILGKMYVCWFTFSIVMPTLTQ